MADVFDIDACRTPAAPMTRNQQLLAEIQAEWAARTPMQILTAEIKGTVEELLGVRRRYASLLETRKALLTPGAIARDDSPAAFAQGHGPDYPRDEERGRRR